MLPDAKIYEPDNPLRYVEFWQNRLEEHNADMTRSPNLVSGEGTVKKRDRVRDIVHDADKLLAFVADMNSLNPSLLEDNNFAQLKTAINERLAVVLSQANE